MAENIKVAVRVRPFNQREKEHGAKLIVDMQGNTTTIKNPKDMAAEPKKFSFDFSYWSHDGYKTDDEGYMHPESDRYCDQTKVFADLGEGILYNAWKGFNCSLFAYGQTGSGKSYSIVGYGVNKGVIPVVCQKLFAKIDEKHEAKLGEYEVTLSMIEIYNEQVRDLLNAATMKIKGGLKIREHPKKGFYVDKLSTVSVSSYENIEMKMEMGTKNRTIASTNMNATSSRAHTIVAMTFTQKAKNEAGQSMTKTSVINLVDLAGSERAASTGAAGDRLKEGAAINQSLSTLGNVISALADLACADPNKRAKIVVPFRDSSLTRLLKTALGGNSKTVMMAALSPADINYDETLSTLKFADRVKRIKTVAEVNESPTDKLIRELREENAKLLKMLGTGGVPAMPAYDPNLTIQLTTEEKEKMRKELEEEIKAQMIQNEQELDSTRKSLEEKTKTHEKEMLKEKAELEKRKKEEEKRKKKPYFWNLNEDPALSGIICHFIEKTKTLIGKSDKCHIKLQGLSMLNEHAVLEVDQQGIYLSVKQGAKVMLNGEALASKQELNHNDRVVFSSGHVYVLHHPQQCRAAEKKDIAGKKFEKVTWEDVHQEIAERSGYDVDKKGKTEEELLLQEDLISIMPMINEVNAISEELDKKKHFEIALVSPQARGLATGRTYVMIKMKDLVHTNHWMWDRNKFINRKYKMQEMYQNFVEGDPDWDLPKEIDPFYEDIDCHVKIGQSQIHLKCLTYLIGFEESIIITDYQAKEQGFLQIKIEPLTADGNPIGDDDEDYFIDEPNELIGKHLNYEFNIVGAKGLPAKISQEVYCKFKMYLDGDFSETNRLNSSNPDWKWKKNFCHQPVTEQLLSYLNDEALIVEVWGKQSSEAKNAADMSTAELRKQDQKEKINSVIKRAAANPGANMDVAAAMRKVETMLKMINEMKGLVTEAKQKKETNIDISKIEAILTPASTENTKLEDVQQIIEMEKGNPDSQVCSVQ